MNKFRHPFTSVMLGAASLLLLPTGSMFSQPVRAVIKPLTPKPGNTAVPNDTSTTTTAATVPVGYQQITVAAATDTSTPVSTVVSVPFYNVAAYAGPVTSVDSASMLSSSSAGWTVNQYTSDATKPYLIHFKSGASVGRYFLITANTATQLTVANRGYDLTAVSAAADTFEILPANTLGILFGSTPTTVPFQANADVSQADNILLWNGTGWGVFYYNGTNWRQSGSFINQNNTIVYPDEGIYITRKATTSVVLTFLGTVPSVTERTDLFGPGSTFISNRFPVDTTLANIQLQNSPNWKSSTDVSQADNALQWNGTGWNIYYYNGTNWRQAGSFLNLDNQTIPSGSALFVTRQSTASGITGTLVQALPYTLN